MLTNAMAAAYISRIERARANADVWLGEGNRYAGRKHVHAGARACKTAWMYYGDGNAHNRRAFFERLNTMAEEYAVRQMAAAG